ncbi:MAG: methylmalonyl-CoA mutase family protein, partial [Smithella sp.]
MSGKTTKEILNDLIKSQNRTPLYSKEALSKIQASFDTWKNTVVSEKDRKTYTVIPKTIMGSDIPRDLTYTPLDNADFDYENDLGYAGQAPFTRGLHANMYRGKAWTLRQLSAAGSPQ